MEKVIIAQGFVFQEFIDCIREVVRDEISKIPKPEKVKVYLSIEEVCDLIDLSKQTVYTMTHKKQIPHIKRGGKLLFKREDILSWIESPANTIK